MKKIYYDTIEEAAVKLSYAFPYDNEQTREDRKQYLHRKLIKLCEGFVISEDSD